MRTMGDNSKSEVLQELEFLVEFLNKESEREIEKLANSVFDRVKYNVDKIRHTPDEYLTKIFISVFERIKNYLERSIYDSWDYHGRRRYFVSFADKRLITSLKRINKEAEEATIYDKIYCWDERDLDREFWMKYSDFCKNNRGFGYGIWKPKIILQVLEEMCDGDILQYSDVGCHINKYANKVLLSYFYTVDKSESGILAITQPFIEKDYTKGDLFDYFGVRTDTGIAETTQYWDGTFLIKKSNQNMEFFRKWLSVYNDRHLIDDSISISPDFEGFKEHRHSQSCFSILCKMNKVPAMLPYVVLPNPIQVTRTKIWSDDSGKLDIEKESKRTNVQDYIEDEQNTTKKKIIFLSFADTRLRMSLERIKSEAEETGVFDKIYCWDERDLDKGFWDKYSDFCKTNRGFGYWIWKPQIVMQMFEKIRYGDIMLYSDAGCHINKFGIMRLCQYFEIVDKHASGILAFDQRFIEKAWTKGDLFDFFGVRANTDITETTQYCGGIFLIRKCDKTVEFARKWLSVCVKRHLIDDSMSVSPNLEGFIEHRHDQSCFSILCKLNKVPVIPFYETIPNPIQAVSARLL